MSKFNTAAKTKTVSNNAGGESYEQTPELALVSLLVTSFASDTYYKSEDQTTNDLKSLIKKVKPKFAAKAGIFARTEYGMRSISHILAAEIVREYKGKDWTKNYIAKTIHRPDDALEIMAYWMSNYGKPIPNALKKGIALGLAKFDEYQISKYKKANAAYSMIDVVNLTHAYSETIDKLMKGTLDAADTWETKISATAGDSDKKAEAWKEIVMSRKIGYFALLRNLRNILEVQNDELTTAALELLVDEKLIKKSLVLPFRFLTAIDAVEKSGVKHARKAIEAISKAVDIAIDNVPVFDGETLVVVDTSGSMQGRPMDIASLFAAALYKKNEADIVLFATSARPLAPNPTDSVSTISKAIVKAHEMGLVGGGTELATVFKENSFYEGKEYKRVIVLSDMETWRETYYSNDRAPEAFRKWSKHYGMSPSVYTVDLEGSGTMQFPERNVYCMAGFSEKMFDVMKMVETDRNAMIAKVEAIEL